MKLNLLIIFILTVTILVAGCGMTETKVADAVVGEAARSQVSECYRDSNCKSAFLSCYRENCAAYRGKPTWSSCVQDCLNEVMVEDLCGNAVVDAEETCSSCPQDVACAAGQLCQVNQCVEVACQDSDDGRNIEEKGVTKGLEWGDDPQQVISEEDRCITEGVKAGMLAEFYCDQSDRGWERVRSESIDCVEGTSCVNGACVAAPPALGEAEEEEEACATDLSQYPCTFVEESNFDGVIVVGENSHAIDVLAMVDLAMGLDNYYGVDGLIDVARLDSEIADINAQNIISVGSSCVNAITAQLYGNPEDCTYGARPGQARIVLLKPEKQALIVEGYSAEDSRLAARVLNNLRRLEAKGIMGICRGDIANARNADCEWYDWIDCDTVLREDDKFVIGDVLWEYKGADSLTKTDPKVKFENEFLRETIDRRVNVDEEGVASVTLNFKGESYKFIKVGERSKDWDIQYVCGG